MSTLPPRYVVCDNENCVYESQLRQVHPIRIGIDVFTYPPAYCGCDGSIEMRIVQGNTSGLSGEDIYELQQKVPEPQLCDADSQRSWFARAAAPDGYADPVLNQRLTPEEGRA